jgi:hypothetical protein
MENEVGKILLNIIFGILDIFFGFILIKLQIAIGYKGVKAWGWPKSQ